jgi:hypothetical protein
VRQAPALYASSEQPAVISLDAAEQLQFSMPLQLAAGPRVWS